MQAELDLSKGIAIYGDSELAINFMIRTARPGKQTLATIVKKIQAERKNLRSRVVFSHVPRTSNCVADWLARVGQAIKRDCDIQKLGVQTIPGGPAPEVKVNPVDFQLASRATSIQPEIYWAPCLVCGQKQNISQTILCDGCNGAFHLWCAGLASVLVEPWHCPACIR